MRVSRLFLDMPLTVGSRVILPKESAHYLTTVLRLRPLNWVIVFNGQGGEYLAQLVVATKKQVELAIADYQAVERESPLPLTLVQAISRPEHIDYSLQKAVELGVSQIIPIITERSPAAMGKTTTTSKNYHQCQCGRNPQNTNFNPGKTVRQRKKSSGTNLFKEGGLIMEIQQAIDKGYLDLFLGPRVLRTETAATAILAIAQAWWGDF
jgi:16S rRNA (uracil1498-N3)-methyltransferase